MAIKIYNADEGTYLYLKNYLEVLEAAEGEDLETTYHLVFLYHIGSLFERVKRRTALRGKNLRDETGKPLLEKVAMTNDDKETFGELIYSAAVQIFNRLSGYARGIEDAFKIRQSVLVTMTGTSGTANITIRDTNYLATFSTSLPVTCQNFKEDHEADLSEEEIICEHTLGTSTLRFTTEAPDRPLHDDLDFINATGDLAGTGDNVEEYIIFHFNLDENLDTNLAEILDDPIKRALIHYVTREWYESIGSPDVIIEGEKYKEVFEELVSRSHKLNTNIKRPTPLF